jgi:hypothetical protein
VLDVTNPIWIFAHYRSADTAEIDRRALLR